MTTKNAQIVARVSSDLKDFFANLGDGNISKGLEVAAKELGFKIVKIGDKERDLKIEFLKMGSDNLMGIAGRFKREDESKRFSIMIESHGTINSMKNACAQVGLESIINSLDSINDDFIALAVGKFSKGGLEELIDKIKKLKSHIEIFS